MSGFPCTERRTVCERRIETTLDEEPLLTQPKIDSIEWSLVYPQNRLWQEPHPMNCPICLWTPDNPDYLLIMETQYWRVCLAPNQSLLGRCVIHLKRHTGDLANLTEDEWLEFLNVVKQVEASTKLVFGTTMFNWSCYMNHSYRESSPDPHIHWWAVPRYDHTVHFRGTLFEDPHFGNPYDHYRFMNAPKELRLAIAEELKSNSPF